MPMPRMLFMVLSIPPSLKKETTFVTYGEVSFFEGRISSNWAVAAIALRVVGCNNELKCFLTAIGTDTWCQ